MRWLIQILCLLAPLASLAAEDDKGRLERFLEDSLSGAGRQVEIQGFEGALSSHAKVQSLAVSDTQGVWLTLDDLELIWSRAALLKGRIEIEKLVAGQIRLTRLPVSDPSLPSPEAGDFALPELPVSLAIGEIRAAHVVLGEPVLGQEAAFSVNGNLQLANGEGSAGLAIVRLGGPFGIFKIETAFANADRVLAIDLDLNEAPDGIVANALALPGRPSMHLNLSGVGPLEAYEADILLDTGGIRRLQGRLGTMVQAELDDRAVETGRARLFGLDVTGNLAPLFAPEYQRLFGTEVAVSARARIMDDGRRRLDQLQVSSGALQANGEMTLAANGLPLFMAFDVALADPQGAALALPGTGGLSLRDGQLELRYDGDRDDAWALRGRLHDMRGPELTIAALDLEADGTIRHLAAPELGGVLSLKASGIAPTDPGAPGLANALGTTATLTSGLDWRAGAPVEIRHLRLHTANGAITAAGRITGPFAALTVDGQARLDLADLALLEPFAKRRLRGGLAADVSGGWAPLTGAFDILLEATARNLKTGTPELDALTGASTSVHLSLARSGQGLDLRDLRLRSDVVRANATGRLSTGGGAVDLDVQLDRVQALFPGLPGTAALRARARRGAAGWDLDLDGSGSSGFALVAAGRVHNDLQTARLTLAGTLPLAALNTTIRPASLRGQAKFDLVLDGPFALSSLGGTVSTADGRLALPQYRFALGEIAATVGLQGSQANLALDGNVVGGGQITTRGTIGLTAPYQAGLAFGLQQVHLRYQDLLQTLLDGQLRLDGPLTGGAGLAGLIELKETEIQVSSTGPGGAEAIPDISHLHASGPVQTTRKHAGLLRAAQSGGTSAARPYNLDLTIRADNRVFVRGLGLDAEFGGSFALQGTTRSVVTSGEFDLLRGRLDFLAKRLQLTEGLIRLEGDFVPYIRMIATTRSSAASFEIALQGRATSPRLEITATPDMPAEQALSYILFGEDITSISPFQAAQLAAAAATLSGQSTGGYLSKLRSGIGLDNLDIVTDETGSTGISAGKHISDRLYTEIGVDDEGQSSISLNLDVSPKLTFTGRVDSDSNAGIGLFYKKDY